MNRFLAFTFAAVIATGVARVSNAASPLERLRGTVQSVTADSAILQTTGGATQTITLTASTGYAAVTRSSLNAILPNSYIGTAAKGTGPNMVALEVVVFPPAMRGAGEGHYPWDPLPDITKPGSSTASSMTNGSVSSLAITPKKAASSMTNGSVQTVSSLPGAKQISVVYNGGKQIILVLPTTPVVTVAAADATILKPGVHVVIFASTADGKTTALRILAGANGITPPM
jgi:hypothetical protein